MLLRLCYMGIEIQTTPEGTHVNASGELQFYDSQKFMQVIPEEAKGSGRNVILDIRELTFIDSSGLGAILYVSEALRMQGQKLNIINANEHCRKLLDKIAPVGTFILE
jgi:anti-sigma B factor antagonist